MSPCRFCDVQKIEEWVGWGCFSTTPPSPLALLVPDELRPDIRLRKPADPLEVLGPDGHRVAHIAESVREAQIGTVVRADPNLLTHRIDSSLPDGRCLPAGIRLECAEVARRVRAGREPRPALAVVLRAVARGTRRRALVAGILESDVREQGASRDVDHRAGRWLHRNQSRIDAVELECHAPRFRIAVHCYARLDHLGLAPHDDILGTPTFAAQTGRPVFDVVVGRHFDELVEVRQKLTETLRSLARIVTLLESLHQLERIRATSLNRRKPVRVVAQVVGNPPLELSLRRKAALAESMELLASGSRMGRCRDCLGADCHVGEQRRDKSECPNLGHCLTPLLRHPGVALVERSLQCRKLQGVIQKRNLSAVGRLLRYRVTLNKRRKHNKPSTLA